MSNFNMYVSNAVKVLRSNFDLLEKGEIPESYVEAGLTPMMIDSDILKLRNDYTENCGFTLVDMSWNRALVEHVIKNGRCLEVMAGTGLWSQALRKLGVDVICTDNMEWERSHKKGWNEHRTEIIEMEATEAVRMYGKDVDYILMSWPYMDITAYKVLQNMRIVNPNARLIYIGEGQTGCCADDNFFEALDEVYTEGMQEVNRRYCSFPGIHDRLYLIK